MQRFLTNLLLLLLVLGVLFFFSPLSRMFDPRPPTAEVEIMMEPERTPVDGPRTESDPDADTAVEETEEPETPTEEDPAAH